MVSYLFIEKGSRIFVGNCCRDLLLQNLELQQQMLLVYLNMNTKKTAGLEDTKAVYVEKLLKQYYEPGTGTCSHQPYSKFIVVYSQSDICQFKAYKL